MIATIVTRTTKRTSVPVRAKEIKISYSLVGLQATYNGSRLRAKAIQTKDRAFTTSKLVSDLRSWIELRGELIEHVYQGLLQVEERGKS